MEFLRVVVGLVGEDGRSCWWAGLVKTADSENLN